MKKVKDHAKYWQGLNHELKVMVSVLKDLSYHYGACIPFEDVLTPMILKNLGKDPENDKTSIRGKIKMLNNTQLTRSQEYTHGAIRSLDITDRGIDFIFNNQNRIDKWVKENELDFNVPERSY